MNLNISAFTHAGTIRDFNQDSVLVKGQILSSGEVNLINQDYCVCFIADGVGGNKAGDFASRYVLEGLNKAILSHVESDLDDRLREVNRQLLTESSGNEELRGSATTLTGLVVIENTFLILHVGDSQMWLRRNGTFFKVTNDQVLNENEANSPLTSYFGGSEDNLKFDRDIFVREIAVADVFLICSDGLFKSLKHKAVKAILDDENDLQSQSRALLDQCLQKGAEDNVSVILIQRTA